MKKVTIAILGAGRAAQLHLDAYKKVYCIETNIKYIMDSDLVKAKTYKDIYNIQYATNEIEQIYKDDEVDVIDICTPPYTHKNYILSALKNNKHVICEKPLCGFFGDGSTDKKTMYESVRNDLNEIEQSIKNTNRQFCYAENFIYAPGIEKAAEIIKNKKSKILFIKGEESLAGSSSSVANLWSKTGGGSLIRVGCHPLSAILYLKSINCKNIEITNVKSDVACLTNSLSNKQHRYIKANPKDVEDFAVVSLSFSDNTKALVIASDTRLGGSKNYIELYCNDGFIECNLTMNNLMKTYFLDEEGLEKVELSEMLQIKTGWNFPFIEDDIIRGYVNEMQDFMESIVMNVKPKSDFEIAKNTIEVIYKAYLNN